MTDTGVCQFCKREVKIPDNLLPDSMQCPFCTRYFKVYANDADSVDPSLASFCGDSVSADTFAGDRTGLPDQQTEQEILACVDEIIKFRAAKKKSDNLILATSLIFGVAGSALLVPSGYLSTPLSFFVFFLFFSGLLSSIQGVCRSKAISAALRKFLGNRDFSDPAIYTGMLSGFALKLEISEEEVISDPFLREVLKCFDPSAARKNEKTQL